MVAWSLASCWALFTATLGLLEKDPAEFWLLPDGPVLPDWPEPPEFWPPDPESLLPLPAALEPVIPLPPVLPPDFEPLNLLLAVPPPDAVPPVLPAPVPAPP